MYNNRCMPICDTVYGMYWLWRGCYWIDLNTLFNVCNFIDSVGVHFLEQLVHV